VTLTRGTPCIYTVDFHSIHNIIKINKTTTTAILHYNLPSKKDDLKKLWTEIFTSITTPYATKGNITLGNINVTFEV